MQFSIFAAVAAAAVMVEALTCTNKVYSGGLGIYKNSFPPAPGFIGYSGRLDANGVLEAGNGIYNVLRLVACDNQTLTFPATGELVVLKAQLQISYDGPAKCITRNATTGALEQKPCATDDAGAEPQLWQTTLHGSDNEVRDIMPYTKGRYPHLTGGKFYCE